MKFGIKLWSTNAELIKQAKIHYDKGDFDYIELSAIMDTYDEELLSHLKGIPVIIHSDVRYENSKDDINFADKNCFENNIKSLKEAQRFANFFNARYIIIHPGHNGSYEDINQVLDEFNDSRICVENMPGRSFDLKYECLGRTKEELLKIDCKNYCLDIAHAIKAAKTLGYGPYELINILNELEPQIIHMSDGNIDSEVDEHKHIKCGNFDFEILERFINSKLITLETPKNNRLSFEYDLKNIYKIKSILKWKKKL